ncbi:hypothetical protein TNCV_1759491 [Trichonephila clavipes]|nr:hypothetical protein TNCV_1759491 [Trichonephila clavipes]
MRENGDNHLVQGPDCIVDALKLPNQAPKVSGESLQMFLVWCCSDGTQHLFCWPILNIPGQSLNTNCPVVNSRYLNLVFGHTEKSLNKFFLSSPTQYTVEHSSSLVVVWPPFELLYYALIMIVSAQYCRM